MPITISSPKPPAIYVIGHQDRANGRARQTRVQPQQPMAQQPLNPNHAHKHPPLGHLNRAVAYMIRLSTSGSPSGHLFVKLQTCSSSIPSSCAPLAGRLAVECLERSNGDRGHRHDGGVHRSTGRAVLVLLNAANRYCRGVQVALEMVEGTNCELDFIKRTPLIPLMQNL